ncbi:GAF domain-containing protein [Anaerobacillus sp. 1_MG-2023]|uniref:GAF domain-containing protein n=1 Tax=Bacillales TaxID=1385 RepID=UPI0026E32607|nr:GAF domain-containing protein [Anaerobacillus sp. 1_MG-2023]MDO6654447.1 GAF domain-containing protein [Anaerobacillus sp. 1_MG-2023]
MEPFDKWISPEGQRLKRDLSCDVVALALQNRAGLDITWPCVIGHRNEKYKYITVRYGKGIAGKVISSGRQMEITSFPNGILGKSIDYPIMLAEQLISAYAVPLLCDDSPKGALLIGYRDVHVFTEEEKSRVMEVARGVQSSLSTHYATYRRDRF